MVQTSAGLHDDLLGQAANEYFEALARGERPSIDDFVRRYPDIADDVRRVFPALAVVGESSTSASYWPLPDDIQRQQLGDFRIVREIGRGGMGIVYEAEQLSLGRRVALKVLPFAAMLDAKAIARFKNEARAAATLDHPHIVPVFSVGNERGVYYYAMAFIDGRPLTHVIQALRRQNKWSKCARIAEMPVDSSSAGSAASVEEGRTDRAVGETHDDLLSALASLPAFVSRDYHRAIARLGVQAASALHHAHEHGVVHRDIKPGNLMVDSTGKLWITDFGLARLESDAGMTMSGDLLGTIRYMAPEQALGHRMIIDPRADVYSLGLTLYELLSLHPVFEGTDRQELLRQIAFEEPTPLRAYNAATPTDLATIVTKAIAKEPGDRYQSADDLAKDLQRFLEHQPIAACPPTALDRVNKWLRRHLSAVAAVGLATMLLAIVLAVSIVIVNRSAQQTAAALEKTADLLYMSDMTLAYAAHEKGWSDEVRTILDRYGSDDTGSDRRGFEWRLLERLTPMPVSSTLSGHRGAANELAIFPDRCRLASVGDDGTLRIWEIGTQQLLRTISLGDQPLSSVAISPDGRMVAAGSTTVYLCDLNSGDRATELYHSERTVESLVFSADGKHLAAGSRYLEVCWLSLDGQVVKRIPCESRIESLELLAGSSSLLIPNRTYYPHDPPLETIELWRDGLDAIEKVFDRSHEGLASRFTIARSCPCGKFIATGDSYDSIAYLLERSSGRIVAETPVSRDRLVDLAYAPDGEFVAIGYRNGILEHFRLQQVEDGPPTFERGSRVVDAHQGEIKCLRFVDGDSLATCGADGLIQIWDLSGGEGHALEVTNQKLEDFRLSPDGELLLFTSLHEMLIVKCNGEVVFRCNSPNAGFRRPAWSPQGDRAAIVRDEHLDVMIVDHQGVNLLAIAHGAPSNRIAFSPDGSLVAIISTNLLQLCRADDGKEVFRDELDTNGRAVAFSCDGTRLAYGLRSGATETIRILDVDDQRVVRDLDCGSITECLAFSPDDTMIASGHGDTVIRLWDTQTGSRRAEFVGHERFVNDVAFSPDGRSLLSSSPDGTVRLWSVDHGRGYGIVHREADSSSRGIDSLISLSSDGRRLAIGRRTPRKVTPDVLVWDLDSGTND